MPTGYSFPIARRVLRFAGRARQNWLARHRHPFNYRIHFVGIPLAFAGLPLLAVADWWVGAAALVGGYVLQWAGHRVEGNDVGELIPLKRLLGLPVVPIALPAPPGPPPLPGPSSEPLPPA